MCAHGLGDAGDAPFETSGYKRQCTGFSAGRKVRVPTIGSSLHKKSDARSPGVGQPKFLRLGLRSSAKKSPLEEENGLENRCVFFSGQAAA
jgi:hypothetical protein